MSRGSRGEGVAEGCRAETLLFIRAIICQPGVAGILFKTSRAYITRASEEGAGEERRGGRRSMAGFYYRDHLFVNIIYTLRGGGFAVARAILSSTRRGEEGRSRRGWLLDTVDDFSRVPPPLSYRGVSL